MDWMIALKGRTLEYWDDEHIYLVDGVIVPSVSQVLDFKFGHKYDSVNSAVLKRAAERGTKVHEDIERYCKTGEGDTDEVRGFKFLQRKSGFTVKGNEIPVMLDVCGLTIAGRCDMVMEMDGKIGGADIKNTATLDKERTALQLNMYRIGFKQCYGFDWEFIKAIHLKGKIRRLIDLPVNENYIKQYIREYKEAL